MNFIKCIDWKLLLCTAFATVGVVFDATCITCGALGWCAGITFVDTLHTYRRMYR